MNKKSLKHYLAYSIGFILAGGLLTPVVSASHTRAHHINHKKTTRPVKRAHNKKKKLSGRRYCNRAPKYLNFKALLSNMRLDASNHGANTPAHRAIQRTIQHNLSHYTPTQKHQLHYNNDFQFLNGNLKDKFQTKTRVRHSAKATNKNSSNKAFKQIMNALYKVNNNFDKTKKEKAQYRNDNNQLAKLVNANWSKFNYQQQDQIAQKSSGANTKTFNFINHKANSSQTGLKQVSSQGDQFLNGIRTELIKDINHDRVKNGAKPVKVTTLMQKVANYRAPKVQSAYDNLANYKNYNHDTSNPTDNWVHGEDTHTTNNDYIQHHNRYAMAGANAGTFSIGNNTGRLADGTEPKYDNSTPKGVADNINDNLMNHDMTQGNNDGHRWNELNHSWQYLGVGITYNPNTKWGSVNEQFGSDMDYE